MTTQNNNLPSETVVEECWSADGERYSYDTLGDLLDSEDSIEAGHVVYKAEKVHPKPSDFIDHCDIEETIGERAWDIGGEFAEGFPDITKEAAEELDQLLWAWIDRHCAPSFFTVRNAVEYTVTQDDIDE